MEVAEKVVVRSLRELDKLVAEHIFDWSDFWTNDVQLGGYRSKEWLMGYPPEERAMSIDAERAEVPEYSYSIADAWQIIEKLEHLTPVVESLAQGATTEQQPAKWRCLFANVSELGLNHGWHLSDALTAPIAICLAALKTKGIDVELELSDA